jgi:hypothetical protein
MTPGILLLCALAAGQANPEEAPLDAKRVAALVKQLDDDRFAVREKADKALREGGKAVVPLLRKELKGAKSLEVRRRLERLISVLGANRPAKVSEEKLAKLVGQLGSEAFEERQKAEQELLKAGKAAAPLLRKALKGNDLEIKRRARIILDRLAGKR